MNDLIASPVAFFAFNRPEHTRRTLAALAANELAVDTELHIFCDGPRSQGDEEAVAQVRQICRNASGFAALHIHEQNANQGLANSLIAGINSMFGEYERVIVFEDDVLTSPKTLRFLNTCLERYESEPVVFNIAAWSPDPKKVGFPDDYPWDIYFIPRFHCWGWATWKERWQSIDWNVSTAPVFFNNQYALRAYAQGGVDLPPMLRACLDKRIDSWAVRADFSRFTHGRLGLNPLHSYVENIGFDNSGTHCGESRQSSVDSNAIPVTIRFPEHIFVDETLASKYRDFLSGSAPTASEIERFHALIAASDHLASLASFFHDASMEQAERHAQLDSRMGRIEAYLPQLDNRVEALDSRVEALDSRVGGGEICLPQLEERLAEQSAQLNALRWNLQHPVRWFFRKLRIKLHGTAKDPAVH